MKVIAVSNLSKRYIITHQLEKHLLREEVVKFLTKPLKWIHHKEKFWALRNITFSINKGEIVGIIGPNGSGKSTLLKVLAGIVCPTSGRVTIWGKVGSLIELGAGFHPDLTGRENIYFSGAVLGLKKEQIDEKFDEIVAFSGVEKFLDTAVKHYSSGMYLRLGFSVAIQLEPDILLIDEVLAVGDAEFQEKSLTKLEEISRKKQCTIIAVSHNMDIIRRLCTKVLLFYSGKIVYQGSAEEAIHTYFAKNWTMT